MNPRHSLPTAISFALLLCTLALATDSPKPATVKGYVIDSACTFTKNLKKPVSKDCAIACAKAGSPLVILSDDGNVYWPFAGEKVTATGKVFQRGGSTAIVIDKIEPATAAK